MKKQIFAGWVMAGIGSLAQAAGIQGDSVLFQFLYPTPSQVSKSTGPAVVAVDGVQFYDDVYIPYSRIATLVLPESIVITGLSRTSFGRDDFYGYSVVDTTDAFGGQYVFNAAASSNDVLSTFFDYSTVGNQFVANLAGLKITTATRLAFDLVSTAPPVSPVPEPEIYATLLSGLGIMGMLARRRRKARHFADASLHGKNQ